MIKARHLIGILLAVAIASALKVYNRPTARVAEEPAAGSGGLLNAYEESNRAAIEDMAKRGVSAPPAQR